MKGKCRVTIVNLELLSKATTVGKCHKIKPYTRVKFTCHREDEGGQPQTDEAPTQQKTISGSTKRREKGTSVFRWVNVHSYRCSQSALYCSPSLEGRKLKGKRSAPGKGESSASIRQRALSQHLPR